MPNLQKEKKRKSIMRRRRVRARVIGTASRPRLTVFRSHQWMSAQLINDTLGRTLFSIFERQEKLSGLPADRARALGKLFALRVKTSGIDHVVFDRGSYAYHGRVAAFADGAREGGLEF